MRDAFNNGVCSMIHAKKLVAGGFLIGLAICGGAAPAMAAKALGEETRKSVNIVLVQGEKRIVTTQKQAGQSQTQFKRSDAAKTIERTASANMRVEKGNGLTRKQNTKNTKMIHGVDEKFFPDLHHEMGPQEFKKFCDGHKAQCNGKRASSCRVVARRCQAY